jgi:hypothetical protein
VPGPVPDEVILPSLQSQERVTLEDTDYALHLTGFRQNGNLVSKFISQENGSNSADIFAKLVEVQPEVKPPVITEEKCSIKKVVDTCTLFSAALESLNRRSVIYLLEEVIAKVNEHCEKLGTKVTVPGESGDLDNIRTELLVRINELRQTTEWYVTEVNNLKQQITSLQVNLPQIIQQTVQKLDIDAVLNQINELNSKLLIIQKSAQELDEKEFGQLQELLEKLLLKVDLREVIQNIEINIDGRNFNLLHLVQVLSTSNHVLNVQIQYSTPGFGDIVGVRFILADQTQVIFRVRIKVDQTDGQRITYVFETTDWKGLSAQFSLIFGCHRKTYKLCESSLTCDFFDGVEQTNIVFDLCPQISLLSKSIQKPE